MNKGFINAYVKYTVKKPIIFFAVVFIGVLSIILLALSTKTSMLFSCDGVVNDYSIIINGNIDSYTSYIYVYSDRSDKIYSVEILETIHKNKQTVFFLKDENDYISKTNQQKINVDIPIRAITIFERVFLKGGKVNE